MILSYLATLMRRAFTLDGEPVDILEFVQDNADSFEAEDLHEITKLNEGEVLVYGGGAFATFTLRRVS